MQVRDGAHAVAVGQTVVQEDDVRNGRRHQVAGLGDRRRLADDEQVGLRLQGLRETGREHLVVVHEQDPDRGG